MDTSAVSNASDDYDLGAHDVYLPVHDTSDDSDMHHQDHESNLKTDGSVQDAEEDIPTKNIFEDHESPDFPEDLLQNRKPKIGDPISFYNNSLNTCYKAIITHDSTKLKGGTITTMSITQTELKLVFTLSLIYAGHFLGLFQDNLSLWDQIEIAVYHPP